MSHIPSNALSAREICRKCTQHLMSISKVQDSTQPISEVQTAIAYGLWHYYQLDLPDTPQRVARVILHVLEKKGYTINETR